MNKEFKEGLKALGLGEDHAGPIIIEETLVEQGAPQWTTSVYLIFKNGYSVTIKKGVEIPFLELYPYSENYRIPLMGETLTLEKAIHALSSPSHIHVSESYPCFSIFNHPVQSCGHCWSVAHNPQCPECTATGGGHPEYRTLKECTLPSGVSRYEFAVKQWEKFKYSGLTVEELINLVDKAGYVYVYRPAGPCLSCGATGEPNEMCQECWEHIPVPEHFELKRKENRC